jgi:hypothetical protein
MIDSSMPEILNMFNLNARSMVWQDIFERVH